MRIQSFGETFLLRETVSKFERPSFATAKGKDNSIWNRNISIERLPFVVATISKKSKLFVNLFDNSFEFRRKIELNK